MGVGPITSGSTPTSGAGTVKPAELGGASSTAVVTSSEGIDNREAAAADLRPEESTGAKAGEPLSINSATNQASIDRWRSVQLKAGYGIAKVADGYIDLSELIHIEEPAFGRGPQMTVIDLSSGKKGLTGPAFESLTLTPMKPVITSSDYTADGEVHRAIDSLYDQQCFIQHDDDQYVGILGDIVSKLPAAGGGLVFSVTPMGEGQGAIDVHLTPSGDSSQTITIYKLD